MAIVTTTIYADMIQIVNPDAPDSSGTAAQIGTTTVGASDSRQALIHYPFPASLAYKKIRSVEFYFYVTPLMVGGYSTNYKAGIRGLRSAFDATVTFNSLPSLGDSFDFTSRDSAGYSPARINLSTRSYDIAGILNSGIYLDPKSGGLLSTSTSTNAPYIIVEYDDADDFGSVYGSPSAGYVDKNAAVAFRYSYAPPVNTVGTLSVASWIFAYKKASSDPYTQVAAGSSPTYTTAAGFFADTDTIIWYPRVTLNNGTVLTSSVAYRLTTVEPAFTAVPISPDSTIEDASAQIEFTWSAYNSVGSAPSGADLQYSTNGGSSWASLGSVAGSALRFLAPANTFPGGQIQWRVRALNNAGAAGNWSEPLTFVSVAAPAAPGVSTDAAPFTTISWSSTGQQAYEVLVDGKSYGARFGTEKSFTLAQPLEDGAHTASVRIQGAYGLWSQPGTVQFAVQNIPAGSIELTVAFGIDADLSWAASPEGDDFLIYRDGVQIGHTAEDTFTDRRALGTHEWAVLLRQANGNYTRSNAVTGTTAVESMMIAPLSGGPWLALRLAESSVSARKFTFSRAHSLRHFSGSPLPVLELAPFVDRTGSFMCAFKDLNEARAFESLWGQVVILKADGQVLIGGLMDVEKAQNSFYAAYAFTIEQIAVEEIVDD